MNGWILWMVLGGLSLFAGLIALLNPFAASMAAELIAGWFFVLIGALSCVSAFTGERSRAGRLVGLALGIVFVVLGFSLLAHPLRGLISLTFLVAILLVIGGVFRILFAFGAKDGGVRIAMILSGAISLILAVMIFTNFPASALVVLGVFLAVELISNGVSMIVLSFAVRKAPRATEA
jgi:uncharacterized membrane protein HdeD (DUF308 family)